MIAQSEVVEGSVDAPRAPVALSAFSKMADIWALSTDEQLVLLGAPPRSTFFKWKKEGGSLPKDTIERLSHLFAIYKALQILLPDDKAADDWVRKPNAAFKGRSALDVMLGGSVIDIYKVRSFLDVERGG